MNNLTSILIAGGPYLLVLFILFVIVFIIALERYLFYTSQKENIVTTILKEVAKEKRFTHIEFVKNRCLNELIPSLEKYTALLGTLATISPYLGLLGTLAGIIRAFMDLETLQGAISSGIAEALIATASGLFIAIIATLAYNYCQHQINQIMRTVEVEVSKIKEKNY